MSEDRKSVGIASRVLGFAKAIVPIAVGTIVGITAIRVWDAHIAPAIKGSKTKAQTTTQAQGQAAQNVAAQSPQAQASQVQQAQSQVQI